MTRSLEKVGRMALWSDEKEGEWGDILKSERGIMRGENRKESLKEKKEKKK